MPTYEYACTACGYEFEQFQLISAKPLTKCPQCGQRTLQRLIGSGGGIIFKGSGFYQTDYRSESYKKAAEAESKKADGGGPKAESRQTDHQASGKRAAEKTDAT